MEQTENPRRAHRLPRVVRRLAVAGLALGLLGSVQAHPASAAPPFMTAQLAIAHIPGYLVVVKVTGTVAMSQADARTFIARTGHEVSMQIWGADSGWCMGEADDLLVNTYNSTFYNATPAGLTFEASYLHRSSTLNEDNSLNCNNYGDEIYAKVRLLDIRTGATHVVNSNEVHGYY